MRTYSNRVIIDTDPGIDDAAAILMALASPELEVEALTTVFGNTHVEKCTLNAMHILEAANRPAIPVYQGSNKPFDFSEPTFFPDVHGEDGLGDVGIPLPKIRVQSENAVLEIIRRVLAAPGEITIIGLGRLTNIALAISVEPSVATAAKQIVVMGGAVNVPGNVSPVASANIWGDSQAADIVYRSGAKVVQVGLDVCDQVEITASQLQKAWEADTAASRLMKSITPFIQQTYERLGRMHTPGSVRYNDVPAMAYAIEPSIFEFKEAYVQIETQSLLSRGQTIAEFYGRYGENPNAKIAVGVDAERLVKLWVERVGGLRT
jgi:inosine-uridine nucleoside N-ribohydrolase